VIAWITAFYHCFRHQRYKCWSRPVCPHRWWTCKLGWHCWAWYREPYYKASNKGTTLVYPRNCKVCGVRGKPDVEPRVDW
jgi:hypothetical protein